MPILAFLISLFLFLNISGWTNATYDPTIVPNNKVGIHILFPEEIENAAKLVNNDYKGSWGYVTIPIQSTDRDRVKWQKFLDKCKDLKIIPLIRVATVPEGTSWVEPNDYDLIDFANFLGDLKWPIANRYVIFFNEVNRSDEYGGLVKPEVYADILANAYDIFKNVSTDFFILPAGLDNAAPNAKGYIHHRKYIERMFLHRPDIFDHMDGWTSHAYPNPDFSVRPDQSGNNKIDGFKYDLRYIRQFTTKKLPVFITEAGWSTKYLSDIQISYYYKYAFEKVWNDDEVIAVTPFLLNAREGPFSVFSLTDDNGQLKEQAISLSSFASVGAPVFPEIELVAPPSQATQTALPRVETEDLTFEYTAPQLIGRLFQIFTTLFGIKGIE